MLAGMQQPSLPTRLPRPIGWSAAAAVIAGRPWAPSSARGSRALSPAGSLTLAALLALMALPVLGQGTRRGQHAAHRPAPTTTTAARLVWLAIAAALGRWLAEAPLHPQMGLEGVAWMALLPVVLIATGPAGGLDPGVGA